MRKSQESPNIEEFFQKNELLKQKVTFLKDKFVVVTTKPLNNFKKMVQQRIRWASKTSAYTSNFAKLIGIIVFIMNLAFSLSLLLGIFVRSR